MLLFFLFLSCIFFVCVWFEEKKAENLIEYFMSESGLKKVFRFFRSRESYDGEKHSISFHDICECISEVAAMNRSSKGIGNLFGDSSIERVAEFQIKKLVERKIIQKIDEPSVDVRYKILVRDRV